MRELNKLLTYDQLIELIHAIESAPFYEGNSLSVLDDAILKTVYRSVSSPSILELSKLFSTTPYKMKAMLGNLEINDYISLELLPKTTNYYRVRLTEKAIKQLKRTYDYQREYVSKVLGDLDERSIKLVGENIREVIKTINTKKNKNQVW